MVTLTKSAYEELGPELADFVEEYCCTPYGRSKVALLPDAGKASDEISDALDRTFGRAETIDRGEVAYWRVPRSMVAEDDS